MVAEGVPEQRPDGNSQRQRDREPHSHPGRGRARTALRRDLHRRRHSLGRIGRRAEARDRPCDIEDPHIPRQGRKNDAAEDECHRGDQYGPAVEPREDDGYERAGGGICQRVHRHAHADDRLVVSSAAAISGRRPAMRSEFIPATAIPRARKKMRIFTGDLGMSPEVCHPVVRNLPRYEVPAPLVCAEVGRIEPGCSRAGSGSATRAARWLRLGDSRNRRM